MRFFILAWSLSSECQALVGIVQAKRTNVQVMLLLIASGVSLDEVSMLCVFLGRVGDGWMYPHSIAA